MIETENKEGFCYYTNTGRPDLFSDEDRERWKQIHEWVKHSDVPVLVNGMFWTIDDFITNQQGYGGGGMQYKFWFKSQEDFKQFHTLCKQVFSYANIVCIKVNDHD